MSGLERAWSVVACGTAASFLLFVVGVACLGGDAMEGKVEQGVYYLGFDGDFTQVSPLVYYYSLLHRLSHIPLFLAAVVPRVILFASRAARKFRAQSAQWRQVAAMVRTKKASSKDCSERLSFGSTVRFVAWSRHASSIPSCHGKTPMGDGKWRTLDDHNIHDHRASS